VYFVSISVVNMGNGEVLSWNVTLLASLLASQLLHEFKSDNYL